MIKPCSQIYSTFQIHDENIYFFGGRDGYQNRSLSIYNTSKIVVFSFLMSYQGKNFVYQVNEARRKEEIPPPSTNTFSAIHNNQLIIVGGVIMKNGNYQNDLEQVYALSLGM